MQEKRGSKSAKGASFSESQKSELQEEKSSFIANEEKGEEEGKNSAQGDKNHGTKKKAGGPARREERYPYGKDERPVERGGTKLLSR